MIKQKIEQGYEIRVVYGKNNQNDLSILSEKYGTDKGGIDGNSVSIHPWGYHTYTDLYYLLFDGIKLKVNNLFELGIGTNNEAYSFNMTKLGQPGASLKMWRDYFSNANIIGFDFYKKLILC
jgi:hypothetical protein